MGSILDLTNLYIHKLMINSTKNALTGKWSMINSSTNQIKMETQLQGGVTYLVMQIAELKKMWIDLRLSMKYDFTDV